MSTGKQKQYLDFVIDPSFQGVNRIFVLLFENEDSRKVNTGYYLPKGEIKDFNVMIHGKNFFEHSVTGTYHIRKYDMRTYDNFQKIATGQGDDYTTGCLLDYTYFKEHYKLIAMDYLNNKMVIQKQYNKLILL